MAKREKAVLSEERARQLLVEAEARNQGRPLSPSQRAMVGARLKGEVEEQQEQIDRAAGSVVYFVQIEPGGPIKIGTTFSLKRRLAALQNAAAKQLIVLGTIAGGRLMERTIHREFREEHIRGEWFRASEVLLEFIQDITKRNRPP